MIPPEFRNIVLTKRTPVGVRKGPDGPQFKNYDFYLPQEVLDRIKQLPNPWSQHVERALRYYLDAWERDNPNGETEEP